MKKESKNKVRDQ